MSARNDFLHRQGNPGRLGTGPGQEVPPHCGPAGGIGSADGRGAADCVQGPTNVDVTAEATVVDAHTFSFASEQAYETGLFVYGKFVDDFLSVDYDALAMLNVSATQELARKVAALEQQNAALRQQATTQTTQFGQQQARLSTLQTQMAPPAGRRHPGPQVT